jgi:hypothetical protein
MVPAQKRAKVRSTPDNADHAFHPALFLLFPEQ